jgi:tRNA threonylcarbamoyladenosine biosynthesis protein TsaE
MATFISHSPAETEALGEAWGRTAQPGLVVGLSGDLGAGKTQLVKGLARGLGTPARVHSPTFTLINIYAGGRLLLFHLDLYRLENLQQILEAGLEEYLRPEGVTVIEWAERWLARTAGGEGQRTSPPSCLEPRAAPPASRLLSVQIETLSDTQRRITYEDSGA